MGVLETIAIIIIILWLIGFVLHIAGGFIHILLLIAAILFLARFLRRNTAP